MLLIRDVLEDVYREEGVGVGIELGECRLVYERPWGREGAAEVVRRGLGAGGGLGRVVRLER